MQILCDSSAAGTLRGTLHWNHSEPGPQAVASRSCIGCSVLELEIQSRTVRPRGIGLVTTDDVRLQSVEHFFIDSKGILNLLIV